MTEFKVKVERVSEFDIELVNSQSSRVHIFEAIIGIEPPQPTSYYNSVAKPEREIALGQCGEQVYVYKRQTVKSSKINLKYRRLCEKCRTILKHKLR